MSALTRNLTPHSEVPYFSHCRHTFPNGERCQVKNIYGNGLCISHGGGKHQCDYYEIHNGVFLFCSTPRRSHSTRCYRHHCDQKCRHFTKDADGNDIVCEALMCYPSVYCLEHGGGKFCSGKPKGKLFCPNRVSGNVKCAECRQKKGTSVKKDSKDESAEGTP